MRKIFALFAFAAVVTATPVGAQPAAGMSAMDYYVGTWACVAGPPGKPPANATATFVMNGSVLSETVYVPAQTDRKAPYSVNIATSYDGKGRYNQTLIDSTGYWEVSYANPWTGTTEQWADLSTSDGKLGHSQSVRTDQNHYTFTGYSTMTGSSPAITGTCQRKAS